MSGESPGGRVLGEPAPAARGARRQRFGKSCGAGLLGALALLAAVGAGAGETGEWAADRGQRGVLLVQGARALAAENERQLFVPASVLKLVVVAAALHYLGPEHRRATSVMGTGPLRSGVLHGDLVLQGAGDPTWNAHFYPQEPRQPLRQLAEQLRERGIRRVRGDLVVDASRFGGPDEPSSRPLSERGLGYGAPCSAVAVDENTFGLRLAPGAKVGERARVGGGDAPLRVENRTLTVEGRLQGRGSVGFSHGWDGRSVRVSGEYPINEPAYDVRVSVPDGNLYAAHALEQALHQAGIRLDGRPRVSQRPVEVLPGAALARVESPPLSEWVGLILRESENWYAEMLLRALALEKKGEGRLDAGLGLEREFLEQVVGVPGDAFFLDDASGLSPYNLLAPEAVVALLRYVLRQPWRGLFLEALARPGEGTLERWPKGLAVRAKTGTIQHTLSLAGYIEGVSGEPVVFALFLNHWPGPRPQARAELQALVRDWVRCTSSSAQACPTRVPEGRAETLPRGEAQAGGRE